MDTTGITLFAKNRTAARELSRQIQAREWRKRYNAICWRSAHLEEGEYPEGATFEIDARLMPVPGNGYRQEVSAEGLASHTDVRILRHLRDGHSFVEARPLTGRTHQIRLHLAHVGLSILADPEYGHLVPYSEEDATPLIPRLLVLLLRLREF